MALPIGHGNGITKIKKDGMTMKKNALILLIIASIASDALSQNIQTDDNVCKDDFSNTIWSSWKSDSAIGKFLLNENEGHDKNGALEIAIGSGCPADASFCFLKRFPVVPGKTYNAIVWMKAENVNPEGIISLAFQGQDENHKFLGTPVIATRRNASNISEGWQRLILTFTIPSENKWAQCSFLLCTIGTSKSSSGKVLFDDFEFFESK